jgi:hypothetical protein
MAHTGSIGITNWTAIGNTATSDPLQANITIRGSYSYIRITINIPLSDWGTTNSNHNLSIRRSTTAMTYGTTYTTESVSSIYGLHFILSGIQYDSFSGTFIDRSTVVAGTTYYYCVVGRSSLFATTAENIGNSAYADIHLEELY